ncbi:DUF1822 family protein [Leptolyngbya cf. ectocarpi LEGE 11479]|uniref:DUF1822 family protein n=1 Tax=Leptolyngbya cf. ectocarpi LEGE 11479 TaxID=1828722 RepID=A0A928ZVN7_LEPEC|nr:DUF1822 family protein [Leptolyngbya ectocarpi]MBE9068306.1 DUF1822 family protein [Leptolyngbya cf. ectocarpi LEGE 11479]
MSKPLDQIYAAAVPLPIPHEARQTAEQFAANQSSPEKARQVYRNTLAVWVMNDYFHMLGIATDLASSDSWNPAVQLMADVADLVLPSLGRLECRPVLANATVCDIPPEIWTLRVGYSVVALSEDLQTARILGFISTVTDETLVLQQLSPPEALIDHLHALRQPQAVPETVQQTAQPVATLSQWFDNIVNTGWVDAGWQTIEDLLATATLTPQFSMRSKALNTLTDGPDAGLRKGKLINLSLRLGSEQVLLLIRLQSQAIDQIHIGVQVYPVNRPYLPANLELLILDESGEVFMQAQARQADNYIQLQFSGTPGEPFTTQTKLENICHAEQFVV